MCLSPLSKKTMNVKKFLLALLRYESIIERLKKVLEEKHKQVVKFWVFYNVWQAPCFWIKAQGSNNTNLKL